MTYFKRICEVYELKPIDVHRRCKAVVGADKVGRLAIKNLFKENPDPVRIEIIKYVALAIGCNWQDLIAGTKDYKGLEVKKL